MIETCDPQKRRSARSSMTVRHRVRSPKLRSTYLEKLNSIDAYALWYASTNPHLIAPGNRLSFFFVRTGPNVAHVAFYFFPVGSHDRCVGVNASPSCFSTLMR